MCEQTSLILEIFITSSQHICVPTSCSPKVVHELSGFKQHYWRKVTNAPSVIKIIQQPNNVYYIYIDILFSTKINHYNTKALTLILVMT